MFSITSKTKTSWVTPFQIGLSLPCAYYITPKPITILQATQTLASFGPRHRRVHQLHIISSKKQAARRMGPFGPGEQTADTCKSTERSTQYIPWPQAQKARSLAQLQLGSRILPRNWILPLLLLAVPFMHPPSSPSTCKWVIVYVIHRPLFSVATTPHCIGSVKSLALDPNRALRSCMHLEPIQYVQLAGLCSGHNSCAWSHFADWEKDILS